MLKKTVHKTLIHNHYYNIWKAYINPRSLLEKIITRRLEGGSQSDPLPPSTLDTFHPIDLKFGTYSKLHFVLSIKRNHVMSNWFP